MKTRLLAVAATLVGLLAATSPARADTAANVAAESAAITHATVTEWLTHQDPSGRFVDPVNGLGGGYGQLMLGLSAMRHGVAVNDPVMIDAGLRGVTTQMVGGGAPGGFELLASARAYRFAAQYLAADPTFAAVRPLWEAKLLSLPVDLAGGERALPCLRDASCYSNLKLVAALGDLELLATGLSGGSGRLADRAATQQRAMRMLRVTVPGNTSSSGRRRGATSFANAGISSDPDTNPLAYHVLSTMMLGQAVEHLGASAPRETIAAFGRASKAMAAFMAPDGDLTYIGRGQGQVWVVAAAADAAAMAARWTPDPTWKGRYLALARAAVDRIERAHGLTGWGLALTPRLMGDWGRTGTSVDYAGIDHYAGTLTYNGLSLWALDHAATYLLGLGGTGIGPLPSTTDGSFTDPAETRFATVTRGSAWYAVHAVTSHLDARYDFGLVSFKRRTANGWAEVGTPRPLTEQAGRSGGPVIYVRGRRLVPIGRTITTTGSSVRVVGGWASYYKAHRLTDARTTFTWTLRGDRAVRLRFDASRSRTYEFRVWYPAGASVQVTRRGACAAGTCWGFSTNAKTTRTRGYASAYERTLDGLVFRVRPARDGTVSFTTRDVRG